MLTLRSGLGPAQALPLFSKLGVHCLPSDSHSTAMFPRISALPLTHGAFCWHGSCSLSARSLLALLEECNPDHSNDRADYQRRNGRGRSSITRTLSNQMPPIPPSSIMNMIGATCIHGCLKPSSTRATLCSVTSAKVTVGPLSCLFSISCAYATVMLSGLARRTTRQRKHHYFTMPAPALPRTVPPRTVTLPAARGPFTRYPAGRRRYPAGL